MNATQSRLKQVKAPSGGSAVNAVFSKSGVATSVGAMT